ncbi:unnamed protein product [Fusarium venenatum]|uniref:Uncharacterized protein n=1 Tax=Fusarium venenatum TaxID=56646 RepID=A0A2L2TGZ5_9HYPO|nr:uncharacterized protein FVRRES_09455 [Fusarium venenatum]KAH6966129.1 hypothetical protein EDB82DRAFT_561893 [Fusarium venenatum]CEI69378.1 unnamed protein product [Fusarium venenatum]
MPPPSQDPFEVSRLVEDSKREITRMKHNLELVHKKQRDTALLNSDLRDYNNQLRGEVADLRAQLTYAIQTLTAQIREQVDGARSAGSSAKRLQDVVDEQKKPFRNSIKTLENQIKGQVLNLKTERQKTKTQKKREKPEAESEKRKIEREKRELRGRISILPPAPAQTPSSAHTPILPAGASLHNTIKEEIMVIDDDTDETIPGLALLEDNSHSAEVIEQLKRNMNKRTGKKNLPSILKNGTKNKCFCIHEVVSIGSSASVQLIPSTEVCKVGGPTCNFLVEVVETASGNRLRTFSP